MEEQIRFSHKPVLFEECMEALNIRPDGIYVDGTAGGGNHSFGIASRLGEGGRLIAIDQDEDAIRAAGEKLAPFGDRVSVVRSNFRQVADVCRMLGIEEIDGLLLDLGFSYQADAPLDMRMDSRNPLTAYDVVNTYSEQQLRRILYDYGEERFSGRIASAILRHREERPIRTTGELVGIVKEAIPAGARDGGHYPAKRTFQAIRIEVNAELDVIEPAIRSAVAMLKTGGRVAVITFHSLEDRIVKQTFADLATGCTCPKTLPVCVCGKKPTVRLVNRKPILPGERELEENPRSRSAKLRIAEKL